MDDDSTQMLWLVLTVSSIIWLTAGETDILEGLWSKVREKVLDKHFAPGETGDLAYRCTFTGDELRKLGNEKIDELMKQTDCQVWLGPDQHAVFYPLRDFTEYNLVLL
jgi:salicylate hydroxylase